MYNGWTNYETWNIFLWCSSVETIYNLISYNKQLREYSEESAAELVYLLFPEGTPDVSIQNFAKINWSEVSYAFNEL